MKVENFAIDLISLIYVVYNINEIQYMLSSNTVVIFDAVYLNNKMLSLVF
jgi:hypothetical protein